MPTYYHLKAVDYPTSFPDALDTVPVLLDKHTYIDDWIFNRMYSMMITIEQYIIDRPDIFEV
jgi:hypothetical protein